MKVILPPAVFPNIDFFVMLMRAGEVLIETKGTYPRRTWRNRYEIAGPNGRQVLTIPVSKPEAGNCPENKVMIFNDGLWIKNHLHSLETAYNNSPFFLYYRDELLDFPKNSSPRLLDFNRQTLETILDILGIETPVFYTTEFVKEYPGCMDLRQIIHPQKPYLQKNYPPYYQVYSHKNGFLPNLSVLDLIFNLGPESGEYFRQVESGAD